MALYLWPFGVCVCVCVYLWFRSSVSPEASCTHGWGFGGWLNHVGTTAPWLLGGRVWLEEAEAVTWKGLSSSPPPLFSLCFSAQPSQDTVFFHMFVCKFYLLLKEGFSVIDSELGVVKQDLCSQHGAAKLWGFSLFNCVWLWWFHLLEVGLATEC